MQENVYVFANKPKSDNHLEGWHPRFGSIIMKSHLNIYLFITKLREEQKFNEIRIQPCMAGTSPPRQTKKKTAFENWLKKIVSKYGTHNRIDYLRGISHNITYSTP